MLHLQLNTLGEYTMANTHLSSTRTVHEGVNNMVSYNDVVFRTRKKRIFAALLIPCIIVGIIAALAFGFRDIIPDLPVILKERFSKKSSSASISETADESFDVMLSAVTSMGPIAPGSGYDISSISISLTTPNDIYDGTAKTWEIVGLPGTTKPVYTLIVDVDKTMENAGLSSLPIEDLRIKLESLYNSKKLETVEEIKNAGRYCIFAIIDDETSYKYTNFFDYSVDNYYAIRICSDEYIEIKKAPLPSSLKVVPETTATYTGESLKTLLNISNLPYDYNKDYIDCVFIDNETLLECTDPIDAGSYTLKNIEFKDRNYEKRVISYSNGNEPKLVINPKPITNSMVKFSDVNKTYDGKSVKVALEFKSAYKEIANNVELKYFVDGKETPASKLVFTNATDGNTLKVKVVLESKNYCFENGFDDEVSVFINYFYITNVHASFNDINKTYDGNEVKALLQFEEDYKSIENGLTAKYYVDGNLVDDPSFTDVTEKTVKVKVEITSQNYRLHCDFDNEISVVIKDGSLDKYFLAPEKLSVLRQIGKIYKPKYVVPEEYAKTVKELQESEGYTEKCTITYDENRDGKYEKTVNEISKLGKYRIEYVFSAENYNDFTLIYTYNVKFNPFVFAFSPIIALLIVGFIIILVVPRKRRRDMKSRQHFIEFRMQLEKERGGVVCESYAKTKDKFVKHKGRLYLTAKAVEFYDNDYVINSGNSIIIARDIIKIKSYGIYDNKLFILSRGGVQKFKVPAGTAKIWKEQIMKFKYMEQCYYTEVHAINADKGPKK